MNGRNLFYKTTNAFVSDETKIVRLLTIYMESNEPDAGSDERFYEFKKWSLRDDVTLKFDRYIRGDVIELNDAEGKLLVGWADQSYQYGGLLGINDFESNVTLCEIEKMCS